MAWKPDYLDLETYKDYPRIDDTIDDDELAVAITAASRAIDDHCNRQFGWLDAPAQWSYTAWYDDERGRWVVDIDDVQDATGIVVEVDGVGTIAPGDYVLEPADAVDKGKAYTRLSIKPTSTVQPTGCDGEMLVTLRWGWTAFPPQVTHAARLQTSRFAARRDSPFGVAGSPQTGSELRLLAKLDPDVAVSLRGLPRPRRSG